MNFKADERYKGVGGLPGSPARGSKETVSLLEQDSGDGRAELWSCSPETLLQFG